MPKVKSAKVTQQLRHDPLGMQMTREAGPFRAARNRKAQEDELEDEEDMQQMPDALSKKIMAQAREQRMEEMKSSIRGGSGGAGRHVGFALERDAEGEDSEYEDDVEEDDDVSQEGDLVEIDGEDGAIGAGANLSEAEERVLSAFLSGGMGERRTLADVIMEKIQEKQMQSMAQVEEQDAIPPKVREVYTGVGQMLRTYRSGKLPKALKMLPHLQNWEEILWITRPDEWSPHSVFACTRIFASNLNTKMAQRFYNLVLLERCRDDIREHHKLNYHLYAALRKALYKPGAFYKGILLPLAQSGNCTLREATIIGSVIAKVSIPPQHSAAALVKLCEMPYSGSTSLFIRILLNKKYALPRRCIDALVRHFCSFQDETRQLPVLWHQALLVFAQRYKLQLTDEQRQAFKNLLRAQQHYQITQEVRRELFSAVPGGASDTMSMA